MMSLPDDPKDPINLENVEPEVLEPDEVVETIIETPDAVTSEMESHFHLHRSTPLSISNHLTHQQNQAKKVLLKSILQGK